MHDDNFVVVAFICFYNVKSIQRELITVFEARKTYPWLVSTERWVYCVMRCIAVAQIMQSEPHEVALILYSFQIEAITVLKIVIKIKSWEYK